MQGERTETSVFSLVEDQFPVEHLRAARADERLQAGAQHLAYERFERVERRLRREGVSLNTAEWFYFRSPEDTWRALCGREGWVLWRPATGEQLAFIMTGMN
jgi:hypothetical protein